MGAGVGGERNEVRLLLDVGLLLGVMKLPGIRVAIVA